MIPSISVVIPAKNEQGNIGNLIKEIHQHLHIYPDWEIVITDDGSTDNTVQEAIAAGQASQCNMRVISHQQSCGQSAAVLTAINHANGEWIITSDGDGQNDPSDIPAMLQTAKAINAPHFCVAGFRAKRLDNSWIRFQSKLANRVRNQILGDGVPDSGCGLKIIPKQTYLQLPYFDHMHRFLPALIKRINGEIVIHQVKHRDRSHGVSNYNAWNRGWVGIVDLFGVMWLKKRANQASVKTVNSTERPHQ